MSRATEGWLARRIRARASRNWSRIFLEMKRGGRPLPPETRDEARDLHQLLGLVLQTSDRLSVGVRGSLRRMQLPPGTDWRWRPRIMQARDSGVGLVSPRSGRWLSPEVVLFHDCPHRALILSQKRNQRATDLAEYALALEVMGFQGSYLSYSMGLPDEALEGLGGQHVLRLEAALEAERAITVYARLNVQQGPNTETMLRQMGDPIAGRHCNRVVEFDLGYAELSPRPVEKAWIDMIFEAPFMNAVMLRDVVASRHVRAQI